MFRLLKGSCFVPDRRCFLPLALLWNCFLLPALLWNCFPAHLYWKNLPPDR